MTQFRIWPASFKRAPFIITILTSLLLAACGGTRSSLSANNTELNIVATEAIDNTIISAAYRFQQQVVTLVSQSELFCTAGQITTDNLALLKDQWTMTNFAWFQLLPYRFGPMISSEVLPTYIFIDYHRQRGDNDSDTIRSNINTLIASSSHANYASTLSQIGANSLGLLALEISIFEEAANQSTAPEDIVFEFQNTPKKCQLLIDFGQKLLVRADTIHRGWTSNYRNTGKSYRDLLVNNQLELALSDEAGESAIMKILVSVQEFYDYLGKRNVTTNVAQLSSSVWLALDNALQNTEELLAGVESTTLSLDAVMANNRFEKTVANVKNNIQTLRSALEEKNTIDMKAAAAILDGNFKRDIPEALNINLGLNFSDGD
jgi:predicted lipoprotein